MDRAHEHALGLPGKAEHRAAFLGQCGDWLATPDAQAWAAAFVAYVNGEAPGGPGFRPGQQSISWGWWSWGTRENRGAVPYFGVLTAWRDGTIRPQQAEVLRKLFFHASASDAQVKHCFGVDCHRCGSMEAIERGRAA